MGGAYLFPQPMDRWVQSSTDAPKSIPDRSHATSVLPIALVGAVQRATLQLDITHPFASDLDISLISPAGVTVEVSTDNGGSSDDYRGTIFDMGCSTSIRSGTAPFYGCYRSESSFAPFEAGLAGGTWILRCADDAASDAGNLASWSLALCVSR